MSDALLHRTFWWGWVSACAWALIAVVTCNVTALCVAVVLTLGVIITLTLEPSH